MCFLSLMCIRHFEENAVVLSHMGISWRDFDIWDAQGCYHTAVCGQKPASLPDVAVCLSQLSLSCLKDPASFSPPCWCTSGRSCRASRCWARRFPDTATLASLMLALFLADRTGFSCARAEAPDQCTEVSPGMLVLCVPWEQEWYDVLDWDPLHTW